MKQLFRPFGTVNKKVTAVVVVFWTVLFVGMFQLFHSPIIPPPTKIGEALYELVNSKEFYEDLAVSMLLTIKAMGYSIVLTIIIVYMATIPLFRPLAEFASKCRYLTLTGLVFVFTCLSNNIGELKLSLLIFGITPFFITSFLYITVSGPPQEIQKGYVNKLGRWGTLWEVIVVGKMNQLFEVMRQNFAISWMMITMVEGYAMNEGGIGTLLIKSNKYLNLAPVFAMLVVVLTLGLVFDYLLSQVRFFLFPHVNPDWRSFVFYIIKWIKSWNKKQPLPLDVSVLPVGLQPSSNPEQKPLEQSKSLLP